jgi:hypothetical protein
MSLVFVSIHASTVRFVVASTITTSYLVFSSFASAQEVTSATTGAQETAATTKFPVDTSKWMVGDTLVPESRKGPAPLKLCLKREGETWKDAPDCDLKDDKVEILLVYPGPQHTYLYLGAVPPSAKLMSEAEKRRTGGSYPATATSWMCAYGALGTDSRKHGYTICSSSLTKDSTGAGEAIGKNIVNVFVGTVQKRMVIDQEAVLAAAKTTGLAGIIETRLYKEYRDAYENSVTGSHWRAFIARYKESDPDNLVPSAQKSLAQAEQHEAAHQARAEKRHAVAVKQNAAALEAWRTKVKTGDTCWVGPRDVGGMNVMMRAMVIESKPPIIRVQYDGITNGNFKVALREREEWVKATHLYPEAEFSAGRSNTIVTPKAWPQ